MARMSTGCERPEKYHLVKSTPVDSKFRVLLSEHSGGWGQGRFSRGALKQKTKQSEEKERTDKTKQDKREMMVVCRTP